jgi:hypothetical protein
LEIELQVAGGAAPRTAKARITRVSPSLDLNNRALVFEADLPNPGFSLRTGLFCEADILMDPNAEAMAVPASAVREFAGVEKAWVVREGHATEQVLQTGRRGKSQVAKTDGGAITIRTVRDAEATEEATRTGAASEAWVEVLAGLKVGDVVVTEDPPDREGPVEVARKL